MTGHSKRLGLRQDSDAKAFSRLGGGFVMGAAMLGLMGLVVFETHSEVEALRRQWNIKGPPCALAAASPDLADHLRNSFTYVGVDYAFDRAGVYCADIPEATLLAPVKHQACQFNNPRFVRVTTKAGETIFDIPPMQRATVFVRSGRAACVLAGWFAG